jgi:cellulose synthase/poly-beta-1,6-N-acetylglucosamine synthase-like glycosyltransferase
MGGSPALVILAMVLGLPGLAAAAHLGLLATASLFYRTPRPREFERTRFLVLVPAHNEARVIGRCLGSIRADAREGDRVLVVADRCTDATAAIARCFGALVLERGPADDPGRAAARQAGLDRARELEWDAVVMLDADSVIAPGFFDACERALGPEVEAVQARSESERGETMATEASLAAFALQGITLQRGRDRLGFSARLRGTGMAIRRRLALKHRFRAPASEDLVFTLDLLLDGVVCRHVDDARLRSQGADAWRSFGAQKTRYEAGRMAAARAYLPRLIRRGLSKREPAPLEAAWFLATPPFALAAVSLLAGLALSALAGAWPTTTLYAAGLLTLALVIAIGLIQAQARPRTWLALLLAPWYLGWKVVVQLRALASVLRREDYYPPTARA